MIENEFYTHEKNLHSTLKPHLSDVNSYLALVRPESPIWVSILFDSFNFFSLFIASLGNVLFL